MYAPLSCRPAESRSSKIPPEAAYEHQKKKCTHILVCGSFNSYTVRRQITKHNEFKMTWFLAIVTKFVLLSQHSSEEREREWQRGKTSNPTGISTRHLPTSHETWHLSTSAQWCRWRDSFHETALVANKGQKMWDSKKLDYPVVNNSKDTRNSALNRYVIAHSS
jgi:hypothetical protein